MASIKFDMKIFVYQLPFKKIPNSSLYIRN
jgi:hypothetical protein